MPSLGPQWLFTANLAMGSWRLSIVRLWSVSSQGRDIPFQKEVRLPVMYRGQPLTTFYRADFVCFTSVLTGDESDKPDFRRRRGAGH